MARIIVVDNPLNPADRREYDWNGAFCNGINGFLDVHFPEGFHGGHRTALNRKELPVEDYDVVLKPTDELVLILAPADPVTVITQLVIAIVLAAASMALAPKADAKIAEPVQPAALARPKGESVYNLAVPTNQTRLGDPIPVAYGRNRIVPDYAAHPYGFYENNDQYVHMLLALGQGAYQIHDVYFADTPLSQLSSAVARYYHFPPWGHGKRLGAITNASGVWENMYTSPEVADQELVPVPYISATFKIINDNQLQYVSGDLSGIGIGTVLTQSGYAGTVSASSFGSRTVLSVSGTVVTVSGPSMLADQFWQITQPLHTQGIWRQTGGIGGVEEYVEFEYFSAMVNLTELDYLNNKPVRIRIFNTSGTLLTDGTGTLMRIDSRKTRVVNYTHNAGAWDYNIYSAFDRIEFYFAKTAGEQVIAQWQPNWSNIGPFPVCAPTMRVVIIEIDIVFPQGLYQTNEDTGDVEQRVVRFSVDINAIDDNGNATGYGQVHTFWFDTKSFTPIRRTFRYGVPLGRYQVTVRRTTHTSNKSGVAEQALWAGLRGRINLPNVPAYGETTMLAVVAKATNGLASDVLNRISVDCTRLVPSAGNNPVREAEYAFYDILTDTTYGGARPGTERVGDRLTGNFDAVFDFDTTLWEALSTVTNAVDSRLLPEGRNFRTIDGDPNPGLPLMRFVEGAAVGGAQGALIVEGTLVATYSLGEQRDEDGVEIEYRNPQTYQPAYALYPANAIRPRQIRLLGCTDYAVAYGRAKRLWQTELYQRFGWAWTTEMDAASLLPGDVVQLVPLEGSPVTCVITKITPGTIEEARIQVEAFEYDGRIYA